MSTWMREPAQVWSPAPPPGREQVLLPLTLPLQLQPGDRLALSVSCFNARTHDATLILSGVEDSDARGIQLQSGQRRTFSCTLLEASPPLASLRISYHAGKSRTHFHHDIPVARARLNRLSLCPSQPTLEQILVELLELVRTASGPGARARVKAQEELWKTLDCHRHAEGGWGWLLEGPSEPALTARFVLALSLCAVPLSLQPLRLSVLTPAAHWLSTLESQLSPFGNAELLAQSMAATSAFRRLVTPIPPSGSDVRALAMLFSRAPRGSIELQAYLALAAWFNSELGIAEQVLKWMTLPANPEAALCDALLQQVARCVIQPKSETTQLLRRRLSLLIDDDRVLGPEVAALFKLLDALPAPGSLPVPTENPSGSLERPFRWDARGVLIRTDLTTARSAENPNTSDDEAKPVHVRGSVGEEHVLTVQMLVPETLSRVMLVLTPPAGLLPCPNGLDSHLLELPLADLGEAWNELWLARATLDPILLASRFQSIPPTLDVQHTARRIPLTPRWEDGHVFIALPSLPLGLWRLRLRMMAAFAGTFSVPPVVLWSEAIPWMEARGASGTLTLYSPPTPTDPDPGDGHSPDEIVLLGS